MNRAGLTGLVLVAVTATGAGGYWVGQQGDLSRTFGAVSGITAVAAEEAVPAPAGPVLYYRHPDGLPSYALLPTKAEDGRPFVPVTIDLSAPPATAAITDVAAQGQSVERRLLYYRNPMGLPDTSPTPKKDGMGMDYIPVYDGEDGDGSSVVVSAGKMQRTGVRSEIATRRIVVRSIAVPGSVAIDERLVAVVATRSEAFVDHVADVTTGDIVRKGDPLVWLYSNDVAAAGAQYLTALDGVESGIAGAKRRLLNLGVPDAAIAAIARDRTIPTAIPWPAPRDGVVIVRSVMDGMKAGAGDELFKVADLSDVWVIADVAEYDLDAVKLGAAVDITVRSLPGQTFQGTISLIYPDVSPTTRTTKVRIELSNPDRLLLPGMYADVSIAAGDADAVLAVPDSAIIDGGKSRTVLVDLGEGRFEPRGVEIGTTGNGYTQILAGIAEGDRVVVSANFLIDAESNLKAALAGMSSADEATP